jgi:hypothetical protein
MRWRWFWSKTPPQGLLDAHLKLQEVTRDDRVVNDLARRAEKLSKENNFAPAILRALGGR